MPKPGVALQMFTLRHEARADYVGTLKNVAAAGYNAIETAFGTGGLSATQLKPILDDLGIRIISNHVGLDRLSSALDEEIEFNLAVGNTDLLCAELPLEDRTSEAAFHRWAADLQRMARRCQEFGARFSYHSHAFEFRRFGAVNGLEIILGEADLLGWEPDIYWLKFAGVDDVSWITRYAARSRFLHLKDMRNESLPADPIDANAKDLAAYLSAALGDGILDPNPSIAAATSVEWLIVEQDFSMEPMLDDIAKSRRYLAERGY